MVRVLLSCNCVKKVIVCNNNPAWQAERVVTVRDSRLSLINRSALTMPGFRFEVARLHPGETYIAIDDDTFLNHGQIRLLWDAFARSSDNPIGVRGAVFTGHDAVSEDQVEDRRIWPFRPAARDEASVDILNSVYVFGPLHLRRYFDLCEGLSVQDQASFGNGEDVVLSHCGAARAVKIDVGPIFRCLSAGMPGIAISMTDRSRFFSDRWRIFRELRGLSEVPGDPGSHGHQ